VITDTASINYPCRLSIDHPEPQPLHGEAGFSVARTNTDTHRLRPFNLVVGLVHLAQAIALLLLSNDFTLPITARFIAGPPGSDFTPQEVLWNVPIGPAVAVFLLLAAIDHLLMAAPGVWPWYRDNITRQINKARWWEYSISASIMIVLIALVTGVSDVGAIVAIAGANAAMILFGLVMETTNRPDEPVDWTPFIFGCIAGAVPWVVIAIQVIGAEARSGGDGIPTFVYGIIVSLFLLFNSFAVNMVLQYSRVGPWRKYLYGEKVYILLSLTAKTVLAWQIFANTLID
jgi:hypothetical protein